MSRLLFSLRGVPDDEADEIRALLTHHGIDYYETSAGNWGISMPALWVKDEQTFSRAQLLLNDYHQQRAVQQRAIYQALKQQKKHQRFIDSAIAHPIRLIIYLAVVVLMIYLYLGMLVEFGW